MAAKKATIPPPPQLVKDKEKLKEHILERIKIGEGLLAVSVSTQQEKAARWADFDKWNEINYEIIATAFDQRRNEHESNYQYRQSFDPSTLFGVRRTLSLSELIEEDRQAIAFQLEKLRSFYEKIDLQHVAAGIQRQTPVPKRDDLAPLLNLLNRFSLVALQLQSRYANRETLTITDEYDVQDLLHSLLQLHYDDIRPEEYTPSYAGRASRMDFLLKREQIVVEVKKTRPNLRNREIGNELTIDIAHYRSHTDCKRLVSFVYDPDRLISNPRGLEDDLRRQSTPGMALEVIIRS